MKKILIIFTFVGVFLFLTLWGYFQTSHAQKWVLEFISHTIKEKTGHEVEVESFSVPLPFSWIAYNVKIKDHGKLLLSVDEVKVSIPFWEILNSDLTLSKLCLKNVNLYELPKTELKVADLNRSSIWKSFPYPIRISSFSVQNFQASSHLLPDEIDAQFLPVDFEGSLVYKPNLQVANIDLKVKQSPVNTFSTKLHFFCQEANDFFFRLNVEEKSQGFLSEIMNIALPHDIVVGFEGKRAPDHTFDGQFNFKWIGHEIQQTSGGFFYSRNGQLSIHSLKGNLGPFSVQGDILLNTADLKIHENSFQLKITDEAWFKKQFQWPLEGTINLSATLKGLINQPNLHLKFSGENIKIQDEQIQNFAGEGSLVKSTNGFEGHTLLYFGMHDVRCMVDTILRWNDKEMSMNSLQAHYGNIQIKGDLHYLLTPQIVHGELEAFTDDSSLFLNPFDIQTQNAAALTLKFYGSQNLENQFTQNLDFVFQVDKVHREHFYFEKALLTGTFRDLLTKPNANFSFKAKHTFYKGWRLNELEAETSIDPSLHYWPFKINTNQSSESSLSCFAKGRWHINSEELHVHLESIHGLVKNYPFKLQEPVSLNLNKTVFDLSSVALNIAQGTLYTSFDYNKDQAHAVARINQVPIEVFFPTNFAMPLKGILSGEASLFGTPGKLTGQVEAHLSQIKFLDEAFANTPLFNATIQGKIATTHISCASQITGITPLPIEIKADLPIRASLNPPHFFLDELSPFSAHINAEGEIAPLLQLLVIETTSLAGRTSVALDVTGSFNDPHVTGTISIADGTFESPSTGAVFHHLNAHLEAKDKVLVLKDFKAMDLNDGVIQGKGLLDLKRDQGFPFTLNLQLTRIRVLNLDFMKAIASGEVSVTGNSHQGKISGHLITDSVQATIPEQSSALAHSIDVKYINLPRGQVSPIFTTSHPRWPVELDLKIDVQKNATIKAKNLSSYWQGSVKMEGFYHAQQVFGDFKIVKGDYQFNGQTFVIKEGTISFAGDPEKKSTLYVIASKDLGKIVAEIILKGPVRNPLTAFRSNPPLSQREILSWILFGRGITDITPFQGAELSQSITDLTKKNQTEPDVLTKIRDKIGIDRIDISKTEGNESNKVSVQVGKYISHGVFVKVNKSISAEANQVGIEANLWPNIKAEAQIGDDASTQLQLKWKRDY